MTNRRADDVPLVIFSVGRTMSDEDAGTDSDVDQDTDTATDTAIADTGNTPGEETDPAQDGGIADQGANQDSCGCHVVGRRDPHLVRLLRNVLLGIKK